METINDIVAELREQGKYDKENSDLDWTTEEVGDLQLCLADRVEAAYKREVVTNCNGLNAAKMREALEAIDKNTDLLDIAENIAPKLHPSHSFVAVQIRKIVRAALAAPPRNCDRFKTKEEAALAYAGECNAFIPQSILWQISEWLDWLLAETKGETK